MSGDFYKPSIGMDGHEFVGIATKMRRPFAVTASGLDIALRGVSCDKGTLIWAGARGLDVLGAGMCEVNPSLDQGGIA